MGLYEPSVDAGDAIAGLHLDDQRALVAAALEGLEHRDRVALEFAEAQDLVGQDLADALDISRDSAYALVHNARDRFAVATLLVSRHGRDRCPELDGLLGSWDGRLTPRLRKRINRHVEACDTCRETRSARVTPAALLGAAPIGVSATVFDRVRGETLSGMGGTTPATVAASKFTAGGLPLGMIAGTVIAGVLAAGVVLGLTTYRGSGDRPTDPASLEDAAPATVMRTRDDRCPDHHHNSTGRSVPGCRRAADVWRRGPRYTVRRGIHRIPGGGEGTPRCRHIDTRRRGQHDAPRLPDPVRRPRRLRHRQPSCRPQRRRTRRSQGPRRGGAATSLPLASGASRTSDEPVETQLRVGGDGFMTAVISSALCRAVKDARNHSPETSAAPVGAERNGAE